GYTGSERTVGVRLDEVIGQARQRVIIATFASNLHRIQQVFSSAEKHGRKVAVIGRSMEKTVDVARELGYLKSKPGLIVSAEEIRKLPAEKVLIMTTGSQGEPMSALTRMSTGDNRRAEILPGDTVI